MPDRLYIVDSCALLEAWQRLYTPQAFPNVWRWVEDHIERGLLLSHREVVEEIEWPDALVDWVKAHKSIFSDSEEAEQEKCGNLLSSYPKFRPDGGKAKWADPWIIARAHELGGVVVTQENPHSPKRIPYVCAQEKIECVNVQQMVNILGSRYA